MSKIKRKYRTVIQRLGAAFIDGIVFIPVSIIIDSLSGTSSTRSAMFWDLFSSCLWLGYSIYMHGRYGQTLGKMALNIKVYSLDEISPIGYQRAFLRETISIGLCLTGLAYLLLRNSSLPEEDYDQLMLYTSLISAASELTTTFLNPKRRALHDLIAGSLVLDITKYRKWDFEYEENKEASG